MCFVEVSLLQFTSWFQFIEQIQLILYFLVKQLWAQGGEKETSKMIINSLLGNKKIFDRNSEFFRRFHFSQLFDNSNKKLGVKKQLREHSVENEHYRALNDFFIKLLFQWTAHCFSCFKMLILSRLCWRLEKDWDKNRNKQFLVWKKWWVNNLVLETSL